MAIATIIIRQGDSNTTPGTRDNLALDQVITLLNTEGGPISSYHWEFVDKPAGSNASFNNGIVNESIATFTPDVVGTYLIRLSLNNGSIWSTAGAAIRTANLGIRIPAATENGEFDQTRGWGSAVDEAFQLIDNSIGNLTNDESTFVALSPESQQTGYISITGDGRFGANLIVSEGIDTQGPSDLKIGTGQFGSTSRVVIGSSDIDTKVNGNLSIPGNKGLLLNGSDDGYWAMGHTSLFLTHLELDNCINIITGDNLADNGLTVSGAFASSPSFEINTTTNDAYFAGNVGIGIAPTFKLDIGGDAVQAAYGLVNAQISSSSTEAGIQIKNTSADGYAYTLLSTGTGSGVGAGKFVIGGGAGTQALLTINNGDTSFAGNVSIPQDGSFYFNDIGDTNWRQGINLGAYTKTNVTGYSLDIVVGADAGDGFSIGNTDGTSTFEIDNEKNVYLGGDTTVVGDLSVSQTGSLTGTLTDNGLLADDTLIAMSGVAGLRYAVGLNNVVYRSDTDNIWNAVGTLPAGAANYYSVVVYDTDKVLVGTSTGNIVAGTDGGSFSNLSGASGSSTTMPLSSSITCFSATSDGQQDPSTMVLIGTNNSSGEIYMYYEAYIPGVISLTEALGGELANIQPFGQKIISLLLTSTGAIYALTYNGSTFSIWRTPDFNTEFTAVVTGSSYSLNSICQWNNKFYVVGGGGFILSSADGITWDQQTSGTSLTLYSVYGVDAGSLIAVGGDGSTSVVLQSTEDGVWITVDSADISFPLVSAFEDSSTYDIFAVGGQQAFEYASSGPVSGGNLTVDGDVTVGGGLTIGDDLNIVSAITGSASIVTLQNNVDTAITLDNNTIDMIAAGSVEVVFDDFESGLTDWTTGHTGSPAGVAVATTLDKHSGTYSLMLGSSAGLSFSGDVYAFRDIVVEEGTTTTLSLWLRTSAPDTIAYDWLQAHIRSDQNIVLIDLFAGVTGSHRSTPSGGTQTPPAGEIGPVFYTTIAWTNVTADLTPYAGQTVKLFFLAEDDGAAPGPTRLFVDDISITTVGPITIATFDSGSINLGTNTAIDGYVALDGVKIDLASGANSGQVLKYNGSAFIAGDTSLQEAYDGDNVINASSGNQVVIQKNNIGTNPTDALELLNTEVATVGVNQYSPTIKLTNRPIIEGSGVSVTSVHIQNTTPNVTSGDIISRLSIVEVANSDTNTMLQIEPQTIIGGFDATPFAMTHSTGASVSLSDVSNGGYVNLITSVVASEGSNLVTNGDFESGNLTGWTTATSADVVGSGSGTATGIAAATSVYNHSGTYCLSLGATPGNELSSNTFAGDVKASQNVVIPTGGTVGLSLWVKSNAPDAIAWDWFQAHVRDSAGTTVLIDLFADISGNHRAQPTGASNTPPVGEIGPVFYSTIGSWTNITTDLTAYAGQTIKLFFLAEDDGATPGPSRLLIDDIEITQVLGGTSTTATFGPELISLYADVIVDGHVSIDGYTIDLSAGATTDQVLKYNGSSFIAATHDPGAGVYLPLAGGTMSGNIDYTPVPVGAGGELIVNGTFEGASTTGWVVNTGTYAATISTVQKHGGTYSLLVGALGLDGNIVVTQQVTIPSGGGTLTFWVWCYADDTFDNDQQIAQIRASNGVTVLATIFNQASNARAWVQHTVDLAPYAGTTITLYFSDTTFTGGKGNPPVLNTYFYLDDVSIISGGTLLPFRISGGDLNTLGHIVPNAADDTFALGGDIAWAGTYILNTVASTYLPLVGGTMTSGASIVGAGALSIAAGGGGNNLVLDSGTSGILKLGTIQGTAITIGGSSQVSARLDIDTNFNLNSNILFAPGTPTNLVINGSFPDGNLFGWTTFFTGGIGNADISATQAHSSNYSAVIGLRENLFSSGRQVMYQTIDIPDNGGTTTLTFWVWCYSDDVIENDQQIAQIFDSTGTNLLQTIFTQASNAQTWVEWTVDLTAYDGQTIMLWFEGNSNAANFTYYYLDDVSVINVPDFRISGGSNNTLGHIVPNIADSQFALLSDITVKNRSSASDTQLTTTGATDVVSFTPTTQGNFQVNVYYRVVTATTDLTLVVTWTDSTGAQTQTILAAVTPTAVGSYVVPGTFINATAAAIKVTVTAGTANQVYVSASVMEIN